MPRRTATLDQIQQIMAELGLIGGWRKRPNGCWRYRTRDGAGLHWSETRGTVWFDGPEWAMRELERKVVRRLDTLAVGGDGRRADRRGRGLGDPRAEVAEVTSRPACPASRR